MKKEKERKRTKRRRRLNSDAATLREVDVQPETQSEDTVVPSIWDLIPDKSISDCISNDLCVIKTLGQRFVLKSAITDHIAACAKVRGEEVIEVGPGLGVLTRSLLQAGAKRVIALEKDPKAVKFLSDLVYDCEGQVEVMGRDAVGVDLAQVIQDRGMDKVSLVASLPYSSSTDLVFRWLNEIKHIRTMTLMLPKEVAQLIVAKPGSQSFCPLSVFSQYLCEVEIMFDLPPKAFTPVSRVTLSVVRLTPKTLTHEELALFTTLKAVTQVVWDQPRKTLKTTLQPFFNKKLLSEEDLAQASIPGTARPYELSVANFESLARSLAWNGRWVWPALARAITEAGVRAAVAATSRVAEVSSPISSVKARQFLKTILATVRATAPSGTGSASLG